MQFHETRMGARFFEQTMPNLVKQLARIADALETGQGVGQARIKESPGGLVDDGPEAKAPESPQ